MFRFTVFLLLMFAVAANVFSQSEEEQKLAYEKAKRESLASWVQSNNKKLSLEKSTRIVDAVQYHAGKKNIDPLFIFSMIKAESTFKPEATSYVGARGLMQVMPRWHKDKLKGRNPYAIAVNIEVGTKIIEDCLDKAKNNTRRALNCYSGGAGAHYSRKIAKTHKQLAEQVRVVAILNNRGNASKYSFEQPRQPEAKKPDVLMAFLKTRPI